VALGAHRVALKMFEVRGSMPTGTMRPHRLLAFSAAEIRDKAGIFHVNSCVDIEMRAIEQAGCHGCHLSQAPLLVGERPNT